MASFSAHKDGTPQTGVPHSTPTKLTFGTEDWDDTGDYISADSKYHPSTPGKRRISAAMSVGGGVTADGEVRLIIMKNGGPHKQGADVFKTGIAEIGAQVDAIVDFNGDDDYVEIYAYCSGGTGDKIISGNPIQTYFQAMDVA